MQTEHVKRQDIILGIIDVLKSLLLYGKHMVKPFGPSANGGTWWIKWMAWWGR